MSAANSDRGPHRTMRDDGRGGHGPAGDGDDSLASLGRLTGLPVATSRSIAEGASKRTDLVTLRDGRMVVVQRLGEAAIARGRIESVTALGPRLRAAAIRVPAVLAADADARPPYLVTEHIPGEPAVAALVDPRRALAVAAEMGRLARVVASVPTGGLRLPGAWGRPADLAAVARRWLARTGELLPAGARARLDGAIAALPERFEGRPAVLAHGDWAPINVLVAGDRVVGVVDWEFARLADPLFDVAWWGALVFLFHPDAWPIVWPAFLEAAGVELDSDTVARLRILGPLRALEALASTRVLGDPPVAEAWASRLVRLLDTSG